VCARACVRVCTGVCVCARARVTMSVCLCVCVWLVIACGSTLKPRYATVCRLNPRLRLRFAQTKSGKQNFVAHLFGVVLSRRNGAVVSGVKLHYHSI